MTDWGAAFEDRKAELARQPAAAAPATLGEVWKSEWAASGLETTFGVNKPFMDAYQELFDRTSELSGRSIPEMARERGLPFIGAGIDRRIDTLGRIADSLPEQQAKLLADYKDVGARARRKAADITREAGETAASTYGLTAHATAFLAGVSRQMVDPVNLATAPISAANPAAGAGRAAVVKWLGKEFAIGAATQAVQEPYISMRRDELGLPNSSFENIIQAGIGQAGFSGLFRAAGAAFRAIRGADGVGREDIAAAARAAEADGVIEQSGIVSPAAHDALHEARQALAGQGPIEGVATTKRALVSEYDGLQPIIRPDGSRYLAKYAVVDRAQLIVSHDIDGNVNPQFPQALQPRDRERDASRLWVNENAARLQPELLGASPTAREGAPVVGADGIVESGNGRVLLIDQAYRSHPERADAYRAYLDSLGFDVSQMKEPVLVRIRQGDIAFNERKAFTDESNTAATAALSSTERAARDARALDEGLLALFQGGELGSGDNAAFIRRFSNQVLTAPERGAFMMDGGELSKEGAARIEAALVAKGWQRETIVRALAEERDATSKGILGALADTSAPAARLQAAMAEGRVDGGMNVLIPILDAFELVDRARRTNSKIAAALDQIDIEHGALSDETRAAVALFFRNADMTLPAGRETIAARIDWAVTKALLHEGGGLFGDSLDAAAVLRAARVSTEQLTGLDLAKAVSEAAGPITGQAIIPQHIRDVKVIGQGQFGPVFDGLANRWSDAVEILKTNRSGDAKGVLAHPDVAERIDVFWGNEAHGLAHILAKHDTVVADLPRLLADMRLVDRGDKKLQLQSETHHATISTEYHGQQKTWLLTTFDLNENIRRERGTVGRSPDLPTETLSSRPPDQRKLSQNAELAKDPSARQAEALLAEHGDVTLHMDEGDAGKVSARQMLDDIAENRKAASELGDCVDRTGGRIEDSKT